MSPVVIAAPSMIARPRTTIGVDLPSTRKKEAITATRPDSGPTEMSIPAVMITMSWPKLMKASAASSVSSEVTLKVAVKRGFWP